MIRSGVVALPATFQAVVILGMLRFGVMTATEVGIVAVLWSLVIGKWQILLMINIVTFAMGRFLEVVPSMLILVPLLAPLTHTMGIDPIHLGSS